MTIGGAGHAMVSVALEDVMRELVAIRALLEDRRRPVPLSRTDRDLLVRLLPPIVAAWGSEPFASRDLIADPGCRVVCRGLSVKQIGRLLSRAVGIAIGGLIVERAGIEFNTSLWRIVGVS